MKMKELSHRIKLFKAFTFTALLYRKCNRESCWNFPTKNESTKKKVKEIKIPKKRLKQLCLLEALGTCEMGLHVSPYTGRALKDIFPSEREFLKSNTILVAYINRNYSTWRTYASPCAGCKSTTLHVDPIEMWPSYIWASPDHTSFPSRCRKAFY